MNDKKIMFLIHHVYLFVESLLQIFCGLIKIITLTIYLPTWDFRFMIWFQKLKLNRKIKDNDL